MAVARARAAALEASLDEWGTWGTDTLRRGCLHQYDQIRTFAKVVRDHGPAVADRILAEVDRLEAEEQASFDRSVACANRPGGHSWVRVGGAVIQCSNCGDSRGD